MTKQARTEVTGRTTRLGVVSATLVGFATLAGAQALEPPVAPIAKQEVQPGVTFEVTELRRLGDKNIVQLGFALDNKSDKETSLERLGVATRYFLTDIRLVDFQAGRTYSIGEAGGERLGSRFGDGGAVGPGERRTFWAWFGAPSPGVSKLAVFLQGAPPIMDVPLAK